MSGWGSGWGNWLSSTVSSVVEQSSKLVQDLTSEVDEEVKEQEKQSEELEKQPSLKLYRTDDEVAREEQQKKQTQTQTNRNTLKLYRTDEEVQHEQQQAEVDSILPFIDDELIHKTTQVLSDTTSLIGAFFQESVQKLKEGVDLNEMSKNTKEMGQKFMAQTADTIGEVAKDLLPQSITEITPSSSDDQQTSDHPDTLRSQTPPATFQFYFDDFLGNIHLQALELLSTESTMKVQEAQRKCAGKQHQLAAFLQIIVDKFEEDLESDDPPESVELNQKVENLRKIMDELKNSVAGKAEAHIQQFRQACGELQNKLNTKENQDKSENIQESETTAEKGDDSGDKVPGGESENKEEEKDESDSSETILQLSKTQLDDLRLEVLKILAQYSANCVELINRIVESWLVASKQETADEEENENLNKPEKTIEQIEYLLYLINNLADEISTITTEYVSACRRVFAIAKDFKPEELDQIQELSKAQVNTIYVDTGDAISNVHNSKDFALPVMQWIYLLSESNLGQQAL